jgi:hypothetical protein
MKFPVSSRGARTPIQAALSLWDAAPRLVRREKKAYRSLRVDLTPFDQIDVSNSDRR